MTTAAKKSAPGTTTVKKAPAKRAPAAKTTATTPTTVKQPAAQPKAAAPKADKPKKPKLVRDSFTMPEDEYAQLAKIKKHCVAAGFEIKKSELLRIGVGLLAGMDPKKLQAAQQSLPQLRAGRPKKQK